MVGKQAFGDEAGRPQKSAWESPRTGLSISVISDCRQLHLGVLRARTLASTLHVTTHEDGDDDDNRNNQKRDYEDGVLRVQASDGRAHNGQDDDGDGNGHLRLLSRDVRSQDCVLATGLVIAAGSNVAVGPFHDLTLDLGGIRIEDIWVRQTHTAILKLEGLPGDGPIARSGSLAFVIMMKIIREVSQRPVNANCRTLDVIARARLLEIVVELGKVVILDAIALALGL